MKGIPEVGWVRAIGAPGVPKFSLIFYRPGSPHFESIGRFDPLSVRDATEVMWEERAVLLAADRAIVLGM